MDLGATICTPKRPVCGICPLVADCGGRRAGIAAELPRRAEKPAKPVRRGVAYLAVRADGAVLVETRPAAGLLGGMLGLPISDWAEGEPAARPPLDGDWRDLGVEVRHTFTHFHLRLRLEGTRVGRAPGDFRPAGEVGSAMPTVMRKALQLGLAAMAASGGRPTPMRSVTPQ
jgi:A/G-specific adenine glycosylase